MFHVPSALCQHDPPDAVPHSLWIQRHIPGGPPQSLPYQRGSPQPLTHQRGVPEPLPYQRRCPSQHHPQLGCHWEQYRAQVDGGVLLGSLRISRPGLVGSPLAPNPCLPPCANAVLIQSCFCTNGLWRWQTQAVQAATWDQSGWWWTKARSSSEFCSVSKRPRGPSLYPQTPNCQN